MKDAKTILSEILSERSAVNPSYSLRAFARDLGISPQQLSNVLNGHRGIGAAQAEKIAGRLHLSEQLRIQFIETLKAKFARSKVQRKLSKEKIKSLAADVEAKNLEADVFKVISNWYHFALLELIKITPPKKQTKTFFSKRLTIPMTETGFALERLERLGLLKAEGKHWEVNQHTVIADYDIPPESVKNFHRQMLEKSIKALAFRSATERYGSSSTIPMKVKDLEKAKELIQKFRLEFDQLVSSTDDGDEVFGLSIQLFQLTQSTKGS